MVRRLCCRYRAADAELTDRNGDSVCPLTHGRYALTATQHQLHVYTFKRNIFATWDNGPTPLTVPEKM